MHISLKQLYKQAGPDGRHSEVLNQVGHFKPEALGQPEFHNRESVSELKKRFQR
jgi:hypothetical protein